LASRIPRLDKLRTLEIDAAEIRERTVQNEEYIARTERQLRIHAAPMVSLEHFLNLERLIIPQIALIDQTKMFDNDSTSLYRLPKGLRSMEIIDSTQILTRWAIHVLNDRRNFSALSRVDLWCDRKSEPLELLEFIDAAEAERFELQGRKEAKLDGGNPASVWGALRDSGIDVVTHGPSERLKWRRLQDESRFEQPRGI
jgi:hypothetical protein